MWIKKKEYEEMKLEIAKAQFDIECLKTRCKRNEVDIDFVREGKVSHVDLKSSFADIWEHFNSFVWHSGYAEKHEPNRIVYKKRTKK